MAKHPKPQSRRGRKKARQVKKKRVRVMKALGQVWPRRNGDG